MNRFELAARVHRVKVSYRWSREKRGYLLYTSLLFARGGRGQRELGREREVSSAPMYSAVGNSSVEHPMLIWSVG
jgi:hypothetical protein